MRKGISPLVAVIMLIAFTLIVAGILAGWATQFAQTQRRAVEYCVDARIMIQRGTYNPSDKTLSIVTYNFGRVPLRMAALLTYSNLSLHPTAIEKYPEILNTTAGSIQAFTLTNVTNDLDGITIQSEECPGASASLPRRDIQGLGY